MRKLFLLLLIMVPVLIMVPGSCFAFIYRARILKKWIPEQNGYQYVIGLSDYHDKQHYATKNQQIQLKKLLATCNPIKTQILVEDLSSQNNIGRQVCGTFTVDSRGGILGGLYGVCQQMGLPVTNVEYRYCRVAAFGPVLNALKTQLSALRSTNAISIQEIVNEIKYELDNLKAQQAQIPSALQNHYAKSINQIIQHIQELKLNQYNTLSAAQYLEHLGKKNRIHLLTQLLTFDSALLDLKMLNSITAQLDKNTIIAIAGGTHIKNMTEMLKNIGYQDVYTSNVAHVNEYNLEKCLGSNIINGVYCVKPGAIDLGKIKEILP